MAGMNAGSSAGLHHICQRLHVNPANPFIPLLLRFLPPTLSREEPFFFYTIVTIYGRIQKMASYVAKGCGAERGPAAQKKRGTGNEKDADHGTGADGDGDGGGAAVGAGCGVCGRKHAGNRAGRGGNRQGHVHRQELHGLVRQVCF